jgi:hypothetical protein
MVDITTVFRPGGFWVPQDGVPSSLPVYRPANLKTVIRFSLIFERNNKTPFPVSFDLQPRG